MVYLGYHNIHATTSAMIAVLLTMHFCIAELTMQFHQCSTMFMTRLNCDHCRIIACYNYI